MLPTNSATRSLIAPLSSMPRLIMRDARAMEKPLRGGGNVHKACAEPQLTGETPMPDFPARAALEALRQYDTPTICNALEIVLPARRALGFTRRPLVAPFPELKPVVGFART